MRLDIDLPPLLVYSYVFVMGAIIGSFLNVCILRIPTQIRFWDQLRTLWQRPSHCPKCGVDIRWYDNVPILGWLNLRGRCRNCQCRISARYPLIEFLNAVLWLLVFWLEVPLGLGANLSASCLTTDMGPQVIPGLGPFSPEAFVLIRFLLHMVLVEALLVATFIDLERFEIPDGSTLPAMFVALVGSLLFARLHLVPVWFQDGATQMSLAMLLPEWTHWLIGGPDVPAWIMSYPHLHGLAASVVGLLVGGGIVWGVRLVGFWALRQEAMGFGDVVLMAMIGAFLGWQPTLIAFFIAPLFAMLAVPVTFMFRRDRMIPYGPHLSLGTLTTILCWQWIFERTRHVFELGALLLPVAVAFTVLFAAALLLMQGVKRLLGWTPGPELPPGTWRSGDQSWFFKGEFVDRHTCNWKTKDWDGIPAAHGTIHEERWRNNGTTGPRWHR